MLQILWLSRVCQSPSAFDFVELWKPGPGDLLEMGRAQWAGPNGAGAKAPSDAVIPPITIFWAIPIFWAIQIDNRCVKTVLG